MRTSSSPLSGIAPQTGSGDTGMHGGKPAGAAMSLGFGISAIIEAVNKHNPQKAFDHNVDPVLDPFGIPEAH